MAIEEMKRKGNDTVVVIKYEKNEKLYAEAESAVRGYEETKDGNPFALRVELNRLIDALLVDIRVQDEKIFKKYKETYILTGAQPLIELIPERDTDRLIEKMFAMIQSTYHRD